MRKMNPKVERSCVKCNTRFLMYASALRSPNCGLYCANCYRSPKKRKSTERFSRNCKQCARPFEVLPSQETQKTPRIYCSNNCRFEGRTIKPSRKNCLHCGATFEPWNVKQKYCSNKCSSAARRLSVVPTPRQWAKYAKRRRDVIAARPFDIINPIKVFEDSRWICHICGVQTLPFFRGTNHPLAPELDHVTPLSRGGTHTLDNVACSCRQCNGKKGSRIAYNGITRTGRQTGQKTKVHATRK
jgi:hypothetical protein